MSVMPLYGFVEGDTMGVVVLARPDETVRALADRLMAAVGVRVARRDGFKVMFRDRSLDLGALVRTQGLEPLERVTLVWE
jgi:hypothetical protein